MQIEMTHDYALLIRPSANRVFGGHAGALVRAELSMASTHLLDGRIHPGNLTEIGGVEYLTFTSDDDLSEQGVARDVVSNLSSAFALFARVDRGDLLRPIALAPFDRYDDDLVTIQRYAGKTNEAFTKLLLNVALFCADGAFAALGTRHRVVVFDPLCGRGTSLNQALLYGADALGIDHDLRDVQAYATFLKTWLQDKRLKHQLDASAGRDRFRVTIGRKGAEGSGDRQLVDVVSADTTAAATHFGRNNVDVIVADLPYGVQHGSRTEAGGLSRRPGDLLASALGVWRTVVRPGGAIAVSWNLKTLSRADVAATMDDAGFEVHDLAESYTFEHRVDRTITRDLVVARRPSVRNG